MKKILLAITALSAILFLKSCQNKTVIKTTEQEQIPTATVQDGTAITDTTKVALATVEGKVLKIQMGKDGYTATIVTKDNQRYFVTISHSNMTNPEEYTKAKVGEVINVTGEIWKAGDGNRITVHEINKKL